MTKSITVVNGSIADIAQKKNQSIAETFVSADVVVIVDTSASMDTHDAKEGRTRYAVACDELRKLQETLPGKIAVLSFSSLVTFCPNGIPVYLGAGTNLAEALRFAKMADIPNAMQFILISDGEPDDERGALKIAATYHNRIDVIYVGSEANPTGRAFLEKLAKASGGQAVTADKAANLNNVAQYLLR